MKQNNWAVILPAHTSLSNLIAEKDEEQLLLSMYGRSRRSVIESYLKLKKNQDKFWKLYSEFQDRKSKIIKVAPTERDQQDLCVAQLPKQSAISSEPQLSSRASSLNKLYGKYEAKFSKLIGKKQCLRLLHLDLQLDCALYVYLRLQEGSKV